MKALVEVPIGVLPISPNPYTMSTMHTGSIAQLAANPVKIRCLAAGGRFTFQNRRNGVSTRAMSQNIDAGRGIKLLASSNV